jgi:hypothetical protein
MPQVRGTRGEGIRRNFIFSLSLPDSGFSLFSIFFCPDLDAYNGNNNYMRNDYQYTRQ